jgi:hypothetical protein
MRRTILGRLLAAFALMCLLPTSPARADDDHRSPLLSGSEIVAATGRSLGMLGNEWWTFAFDHPEFLSDTTGEFSALGDVPGPVFFAQGSGGDPVNLKVNVPRGQLLLLPIATYIWTLFDPCADVVCARRIINENFLAGVRDVNLRIDGEDVEDLDSLLVKVSRNNPAVFTVDAGEVQPDGYGGPMSALQGGYWALLRPLSPGRHVIDFSAVAPNIDGLTGERIKGKVRLKARLTVTVAR